MSIELADRLIADLATGGIVLSREGDRLIVSGRPTPTDIRRIRRLKPDLLRAVADRKLVPASAPALPKWDGWDAMVDEFCRLRWENELNLVGAVYARPAETVPAAESAGLLPVHIDQPDLRLLYLAAEVGHDKRNIVGILRLARAALIGGGWWSDDYGWRADTLCAVPFAFPCSPIAVRYYARCAIEFHDAHEAAAANLREAWAILNDLCGPEVGRTRRSSGTYPQVKSPGTPDTSTRRGLDPVGQCAAVVETLGTESRKDLALHGPDPLQQAAPLSQASDPDIW